MRRMNNASVSNKDRIICQSIPNKLMFSYQPANSKESDYLFEVAYAPSVLSYFRDKGCKCKSGNGYSLTVGQFYSFHDWHNTKLARVISRVPAMVDYVLAEKAWEKEYEDRCVMRQSSFHEFDDERVA